MTTSVLRVVVTGGRDFADHGMVSRALSGLAWGHDTYVLICGMARGADSLAHEWAQANGWLILEFPAQWDVHGKAAGAIRNQQMIDAGCPHICVAFPGGRGTADMVRRCRRAGIKIFDAAKETP